MTGEDVVSADRKYGGTFEFTNRALFAFATNEILSVGENSRAFKERIKPFRFDRSFAGQEDASIERRMLQELPGILNRWIKAYQRLTERGHFLPSAADVAREFETRSDRVLQWLDEVMIITPASPELPNLPELLRFRGDVPSSSPVVFPSNIISNAGNGPQPIPGSWTSSCAESRPDPPSD
jgi:hypothetical protein